MFLYNKLKLTNLNLFSFEMFTEPEDFLSFVVEVI